MKKYFNFLMMALVVILTCVSLSSCSDDDEDPNDGWGDYYFQLYSVQTNLVDEDGNNLAISIKDEWKDQTGADSEYRTTIGHCNKNTAKEWFDKTIQAYIDAYTEAYCGKLVKDAVIYYNFSLGDYDGAFGTVSANATIKVTNDNVTIGH